VPSHGQGHGDRNPSLTIADGDKGLLVTCHAGCDPRDVLRALGYEKPRANGHDHHHARDQARARVVATYTYRTAEGEPYLQIRRLEPKGFPQFHLEGGKWVPGKPSGPKVPYRLPELLKAADSTVLVVEGEKDADRLASLGFHATTASEGAGKWTADLNEWFKGKRVYILPDHDDAGHKHAQLVARNLYGVAAEVRVARLPRIHDTEDVSDWMDRRDGSADELIELMRAAPVWTPEPVIEEPGRKLFREPYRLRPAGDIPPRRFAYGRHYVGGFMSATIAHGAVGKTSLVIVEGLAMATGRPLLGIQPPGPLRYAYGTGEDPQDEVDRRLTAAALHHGVTTADVSDRLFVDGSQNAPIIMARQDRNGVQIAMPVVQMSWGPFAPIALTCSLIDPFVSSHAVGENDNGAIEQVVRQWRDIARETGCAIDLLHHPRKTGGAEVKVEDSRGAGSLIAAARAVRVLNVMSEDEATKAGVEDRRWYFRVDSGGKSNLSAPAACAEWYRRQSVHLENGDDVGTVERWNMPKPFDGVTKADLLAVQTLVASGRWRENHQARDWVGKAVAEVLSLDVNIKRDRVRILTLVKTWIANAALVVVTAKDEKGDDRPFVEVGQWARDQPFRTEIWCGAGRCGVRVCSVAAPPPPYGVWGAVRGHLGGSCTWVLGAEVREVSKRGRVSSAFAEPLAIVCRKTCDTSTRCPAVSNCRRGRADNPRKKHQAAAGCCYVVRNCMLKNPLTFLHRASRASSWSRHGRCFHPQIRRSSQREPQRRRAAVPIRVTPPVPSSTANGL
jgi:5S rRNA maturation endonuclease (ribonuclease M5)